MEVQKSASTFAPRHYAVTTCNKGIVPWCKGSTTDFDSVCPGSNPGGTTNSTDNKGVTKVTPFFTPKNQCFLAFVIF